MPQTFLTFVPWFLLLAGLTSCSFSTKIRCDIFETAFWFLCFYRFILARCPHPPDTTERITSNKYAFLYTTDQLRHALSTFYTLIVVLRNSSCPVYLNRLGSNPLEHLFGKAKLRCCNVNIMKRFLSAIGLDLLTAETDDFLRLIKVPKRRNGIRVDYDSWTPFSDSIFTIKPIDITTKFLMVAGLPINDIYPTAIETDSAYLRSVLSIIVLHEVKGKTCISRTPDRKEMTRCLSTGKIFLGVQGSLCRDALLQSKWEGANALSPGAIPMVSQIDRSLNLIFGMRLPAGHLREIIPRRKQIMNSPAPKTRRPSDTSDGWQLSGIALSRLSVRLSKRRD
jgi:hypothetical protein